MYALPRAVVAEGSEVVVHAGPRPEVARQHPSRVARMSDVEDGVDHLPHLDGAGAAAGKRLGYQRLDEYPLLVGQLRWVTLPCHNDLLVRRRLFVQVLRPWLSTCNE